MFERFTPPARQVVVLAQDEARTLKHKYIGTEHILLGLLREEEDLGARVLESLDVNLEAVRAQVARIVGPGDEVSTGMLPFTPRAKKALELALRESLSLGHDYIGTEHLLLALTRVNDGVAAQILADLGAGPQKVRSALEELVGKSIDGSSLPPEPLRIRRRNVLSRSIPLAAALLFVAVGILVGWAIWGH